MSGVANIRTATGRLAFDVGDLRCDRICRRTNILSRKQVNFARQDIWVRGDRASVQNLSTRCFDKRGRRVAGADITQVQISGQFASIQIAQQTGERHVAG